MSLWILRFSIDLHVYKYICGFWSMVGGGDGCTAATLLHWSDVAVAVTATIAFIFSLF